ncbi:hypothetical protein [uncultured Catenibacterium sp.]|uniref:hypothetical protein n=1 Tax=uncultured Catenibacterium sp. TaxID=286142 RepID=UPI0025EF3202|nr:hypothetical protein [uncultured Catenibacterium sp.]
MVRAIIGVIIIIAIIRLQIFLSKKDNKLFGLIIPIVIFASSLIFTFGFIPTHNKIETTQSVMTETGEVVESSSDKKTSVALVDHSLTTTSIVYTIVSINAVNFVMLGIYFYCRHKKNTHIELKRMKANELF